MLPSLERRGQDLRASEQHHRRDAERGERLVLAMAVGMIGIGRLARGGHADQTHDVGRAVQQRMNAVRRDGNRARPESVGELRRGHRQVGDEDAAEHTGNRVAALVGGDARHEISRDEHSNSRGRKPERPRACTPPES